MSKTASQSVTIVNTSDFEVRGLLTAKSADGQAERTAEIPSIGPGAQGQGEVEVWRDGTLTVQATWSVDGKEVTSRSYEAAYSPDDPVTALTATLSTPTSSGTMGIWQSVEWAPPEGM
ncbi:MAG: hypothetical protein EA397_07890 [Deltaproteobacteria bacterium]|nr:MAG: hypothetical protein EA397_07890 [Deltaproteobacteria bacterium]